MSEHAKRLVVSMGVLALLTMSCVQKGESPTLEPAPTPESGPAHTSIVTSEPGLAEGLIDAHNHLPRGVTLDHLIQLMDEAHVAKTVLMTVYYGGGNPQGQGIADEHPVLEFYTKRPDRIIPFLGMQRPLLADRKRWIEPDAAAENLLRFAESQLRTGFFRGMGEFILWHYPYSYPGGPQGGTLKVPADTPLMKRFLDLAAKYQVPVTIHYEIDADSLPALKRMLEYGRKTTIILAHNCGRPDPATLMAILGEYPHVFCDLGGMTHLGHYGYPSGEFVKNPIDDGAGHLRPEWKALYEQYPNRFIIGTDLAHPEPWARPEGYERMITIFRSLLSDLSPEAAEKIGFRNAQRLFVPLPLVDVHEHVTPGLTAETILSLMNQAGVTKVVLMANVIPRDWPMGAEDKLTLDVYQKYPDRVIPFLTTARWGWAIRERAFLEYVDRQLANRKFRGLGEFMVKHYAVHAPDDPSKEAPDITVYMDSPRMQDMLCLGAKHNVPLLIHMETTSETVLALERALQRSPNTKVIWAHQNPVKTGGGSAAQHARKADPEQIAALLEKYPNLFADISVGYELWFLTDSDRQLPDGWKALYEKYSDRFVVGFDRAYKDQFEKGYLFMAAWIRDWLAQLSEDTRKKLAHENIERILSAKPSQGQTCDFSTQ